ncbi:hypothetical protein B4U80_13961 [Leptotrombidium deliense]|uniref:Uncharacterized protein n=1 Tax=Leptotrombidium deliense TaxID=299467 RepID=A0A443S6N7_9ACAR|nr:hypothetical protein B4U80_13961 [Leptotrombidium deliense]
MSEQNKASIINFDDICNDDQNKYKNIHELAPQWPFKMIICGHSGSGKTNFLLNLIIKYLCFNKLYIYAKRLNEPKYEYLKKLTDEVSDNIPEGFDKNFAEFRDSLAEVIPLNDIDEERQNLVVFDDFINEKDQSVVCDYFTMGRKWNCSIIYIAHDYFKIPSIIKKNTDYISLFNINSKNYLREIIKDLPISKHEIMNLVNKIKNKPHSFLFIDFKTSDPNLKLRINLDNC